MPALEVACQIKSITIQQGQSTSFTGRYTQPTIQSKGNFFPDLHQSNYKSNNKSIHPTKQPEECMSVDSIESNTAGFVVQMKGCLTNRRYEVATVYVDHYSHLSYVHLQIINTGSEVQKSKIAFEKHAMRQGIHIRRYHTDNGRFSDNTFLNDLMDQCQKITYFGVDARHQNSRAEKRIRDLPEKFRILLLHAIHQMPNASTSHLWPSAL